MFKKKKTWPYKGQKKEQNLGSAQDRVGQLCLTSSSSQICLTKQLINICHKPLILAGKIPCKKEKYLK